MSALAQTLRTPAPEAECPPESLLLELSQGAIEGPAFDSALVHLDACAACRSIVAELARESAPSADAPGPRSGDSIDRFLLLDELGRGGMGVVFAAFDRTLDRRVALKLVRPDPSLPAQLAAQLLLTEAQALARLSHPNVVTVFEARAHGEQVYLAMELIAGRTLRELSATRPGWRVLLARFCEAGRGLGAAHDAGLVHRDFKPDNALLGDDGRVCVTDFGLAQKGSSAQSARPEPAGTPGYIAPELWLGRQADARSDQFSFCVALWEALYGARPFCAERGAALLAEIRGGPMLSLRSQIPVRVRRALQRGLSFEPRARHDSMRALLDELGAELRPPLGANLSGPLLATLACALLGAGATGHAVWLEARAGSSHPAALASSDAKASPDAASLLGAKLPPAQRADATESSASPELSDAESYARASFSSTDDARLNTPPAARCPSTAGALALAQPPPHRRAHRLPHAPIEASRSRAPAPIAVQRDPAPASLAQISPDDGRDGGPSPAGNSGGGSSSGDLKGSSSLVPASDPVLNTRTLR